MIGVIDSRGEIDLFLTPAEIREVRTAVVEGEIVNLRDREERYDVAVASDDEDLSDDRFGIALADDALTDLLDTGAVESAYGEDRARITLHNAARIDEVHAAIMRNAEMLLKR